MLKVLLSFALISFWQPLSNVEAKDGPTAGGWSEWSQCSIGCGYGGVRRRYSDGVKRENFGWKGSRCECQQKVCCHQEVCDLPKCPDMSWDQPNNTIILTHDFHKRPDRLAQLESEIKEMTQCHDCRQCNPKCKPCKCHMKILYGGSGVISLHFRDSNHPTTEEFKQMKGITSAAYDSAYDIVLEWRGEEMKRWTFTLTLYDLWSREGLLFFSQPIFHGQ